MKRPAWQPSFSSTANPRRTAFKNAPMRRRAVKYADARFDRESREWAICRAAFIGGYTHSQRLRCIAVRVRLSK
jgi:hypothetical protein